MCAPRVMSSAWASAPELPPTAVASRGCQAVSSLDARGLRLARTLGHSPVGDLAVARFSALGEHAAVWLAIGAAQSARCTGEKRTRWRRATAVVAGTYLLNTALKLIVRRARPELDGLVPLTSTPHASASRALTRPRRSRRPWPTSVPVCPAVRCTRLQRGWLPPGCISACTIPPTCSRAPCSARRSRPVPREHPHRHRRVAQRR